MDLKNLKVLYPMPEEAKIERRTTSVKVYCLKKQKEWHIKNIEGIFDWYDIDGSLIGQIIRTEKDPKTKQKKILTIFACESEGKSFRCQAGWKALFGSKKKPLFNLQSLKTFDTVDIHEGELTTHALNGVCFTDRGIVCNQGGAGHVDISDWSPLARKSVRIFPDNDDEGFEAAYKTAKKLIEICPRVTLVKPPADKPKGWDLRDAVIEEGLLSIENLNEYIKENSILLDKNIIQNELNKINPKLTEVKVEQQGVKLDDLIRPLGHEHSDFYYYPQSCNQLIKLSANSHTSKNLLSLLKYDYWLKNFPRKEDENNTAVDWTRATDYCISSCHKKGIFNPENLRGRGIWLDKNRRLAHLGDKLLINNEEFEPATFNDTKYIYEAGGSLGIEMDTSLEDAKAPIISQTLKNLNWEYPVSADLLAGWTVIAPICGALNWRPQIWITGPAGSGKTTVISEYIDSLLGNVSVSILGGSSEAGLRQFLGKDALPVIYDESEPEDKAAKSRNKALLFLVRAASSQSKAKIIKGTPNHSSVSFLIHSCFLFSSTVISLEHQADKSRFTILSLKKPEKNETSTSQYQTFLKICDTMKKNHFGNKLIARSYQLIDTINHNALKFSEAISLKYGSRRFGDQYGYLIAGAESLLSKEKFDESEILNKLSKYDLKPFLEDIASSQELDLLSKILQIGMTIKIVDKPENGTLGYFLDCMCQNKRSICNEPSRSQLEILHHLIPLGIKYSARDQMIYFACNSELIKRELENTSVPSNWNLILSRLPGVISKPVHFGAGFPSPSGKGRAIGIPVNLIISDHYNDWEDSQYYEGSPKLIEKRF